MAIGNPFLATWDVTGVVRMFEYTGGAFVQLGSVGGLTHTASGLADGAMEFPFLAWMGDDDFCAVVVQQNSSQAYVATVSPIAASLDTEVIANGVNYGPMRASQFDRDALIVNLNEWNSGASVFSVRASVAGAISLAVAATIPQYRVKLRESSPDGSLMLTRAGATGPQLYTLSSAPSAQPLTFSLVGAAPFTITCDMAKWAANNKCVVVVDKTAARAQVWRYEASEWTMLQELPMLVGTPTAMAMSPDGRMLAVSALSGGVYTTRLFRRIGEYFQFVDDLAGIGAMLDFSADGKLLVDCTEQACYLKDASDTFVDHASAMANIPTAIAAQALSYGRIDPYGVASLFDGAPAVFADETYNPVNLKLTLLTSAATFDRTDTAPDLTNEITTGGWPAGGVVLQNVVSTAGAGSFTLSADPVERVVIESALTARYVLIYDATINKPLIFIDLINDRVVVKNRTLQIDFRDGDFLKFMT